jgi:3',5'-cyclic AMP phosphodiesterase CpdA
MVVSAFLEPPMRKPLLTLSAFGLVLALPGCIGGIGSYAEDPVTLSFVTVGCDRVDRGDWPLPRPDPDPDPSAANVNQLKQTFADVATLDPVPSYFFFTGDLVLGDTQDDGATLGGQLNAWDQIFRLDPLSASPIRMVPLPGNHEMLAFDPTLGGRVCLPAANPTWSTWMASRGFDLLSGNGPSPSATDPGPDDLMLDESRLTYSRNLGPTHFVFLNTDTFTRGGAIGRVAFHWLTADLVAAQADPHVRDILILGHKPILPAAGAAPGADVDDRAITPSQRQPMVDLLVGTPKVKAYFCSHAHQYEATRLGNANGPWQIIVGNGGSSLESTWLPTGGAWYGFLQVNLHATGRITAIPYARPVPSPYLGPATAATPRAELVIVP